MQNVAQLLADRLLGMTVGPKQTPEENLGFSSFEDLDAWRNHSIAVDLLRSVDHTLVGMEAAGRDTSMFTRALPRWYAGVLFATTPWGTRHGNSSRRACSPGDIDLLHAFGALIDGWEPVEIDEDSRRTLSDTLEEAENLLREDSASLPPDARFYLWGLIAHARDVLTNAQAVGATAIRQATIELGGAMIARAEVTESTQPVKAGRWRAIGHTLVSAFVQRTGTEGAELAGRAAKAAIEQAGG